MGTVFLDQLVFWCSQMKDLPTSVQMLLLFIILVA